MNTPIAAVLWTEQARRDLSSVMRLMSHVERCCQDLGSEEAAALVAEALEVLARDGAARRKAA